MNRNVASGRDIPHRNTIVMPGRAMARKRNLLVLQRLAEDSNELESMAAELSGEVETLPCGAQPAHWTSRFAASGKVAIGKQVLADDEESV
jgi:hypothetical protein